MSLRRFAETRRQHPLRRPARAGFLALLILGSASDAAEARVIRVAQPGDAGSRTCGSSWSSPCDLQYALRTVARSGDSLWVKQGTYSPGSDRTSTFRLRSGVALYGGFAGAETRRGQRDWQANATVLSGEIGAVGPTDNVHHVVTARGVDATAVLDGFTVSGGYTGDTDAGEGVGHGAGMYVVSASPAVANCTFRENFARDFGGGVYVAGGALRMRSCTVYGNSTGGKGGGVAVVGGASLAIIRETLFSNNIALYGGGLFNSGRLTLDSAGLYGNRSTLWGGGLYSTGTATIDNCDVKDNSSDRGGGLGVSGRLVLVDGLVERNRATDLGGGMALDGAVVAIARMEFSNNSASSGGGLMASTSTGAVTNCQFRMNNAASDGGAVAAWSDAVAYRSCEFWSNNAGGRGGGIFAYDGSNATVSSCAFRYNAAGHGGAIFNSGSDPTLTGCRFDRNSARDSDGGAIYNVDSSPTITGCAFTFNTASLSGGGVFNFTNSSPEIANSTFAGNAAANGAGVFLYNGGSAALSNCTFADNAAGSFGGGIGVWSGSSAVVRNCVFWGNSVGQVAVRDASATATVSSSIVQGGCPAGGACARILDVDPRLGFRGVFGGVTESYLLPADSPAVDAGDDAVCAAAPVRNRSQNGVRRPQGAHCDIGATETGKVARLLSQGALDGWVLESSETSEQGGWSDAAGDALIVGDDADNRQYLGVLSFNTSGLPDRARVYGAQLAVNHFGGAGVNPLVTHGGWALEIKRGAFSGRAALQPSDFEAEPTRGVRDNLSVNSRTTFPLDAQACTALNRVGVTQFRLGLGLEDDNDFVADQEMVWSGGAAVADRPALVVYYTVP